MSVLKKLSKKDAVKYNFTLSIESIDQFRPHGDSTDDDSSRRKSIKLPFDRRGSLVLHNPFKKGASSTADDSQRMLYAVFWKRGTKRNGKTKFLPISRNKLVVNDVFSFNGTMFKTKKGFLKKKLKLDIHERGENEDDNSTGQKIGGAEVNLAEFCEDHDGENATPVEVVLDMKKGDGLLKLTITTNISDDLGTMSTFSDDTSEMTDPDFDDMDTKRNKRKSIAVSVLESENGDLREDNLYLKRKIDELESVCRDEAESGQLILDLQRERDALRQKLKQSKDEVEQMKIERDKAIKECQEIKKSKSITSKLQRGFGDITSKVTLGIVHLQQEEKPNEYEKVETNYVEKIEDLERENMKLKQQIKRLNSDTSSSSSFVEEDADQEKEKLITQIADLRKKLATVDLGKDNKKDRKKSQAAETIAGYIQEEISSFVTDEILPLVPSAISRNQPQFTIADMIVSRLTILKTLVTDGTLNEAFLIKTIERIDNEMFRILIKKTSLESNDGFKAKLAISVLENFIIDVLGEEKGLNKNNTPHFHRTRQCADICVLNKSNVLRSEETRRLVAPNLEFTEVKAICQKLGLVN